MKILFTLDYELFLGSKTGTVNNCLIEPIKQILTVSEKYNIKFTIFADAVYLYKLSLYAKEYPQLKKEYDDISAHLQMLTHNGHDVELHIHPHWFFSLYDGQNWLLNKDHYKLSDLSEVESFEIFAKSKTLLDGIIGRKTTAFRAGGFSAQPTSLLTSLFIANDLMVDSSVYPENFYKTPQQEYDYRECCKKSIYRFDDDICKEDVNGRFIEVPLNVYNLSPIFYWKYVATKLLKNPKHKNIGDGISVKTSIESLKDRLFKKTSGFATIDGYKISYLFKAYQAAKDNCQELFCIIGHPKLTTPYSIGKLERFCEKVKDEVKFITLRDINE